MTTLRRFLSLSAILTASTLAAAQAETLTAGEYKLAVGSAAPCTITLSADGSASLGACAAAPNVGHWQQHGSTIQLSKGNGEVYALLKAKGDAYAGTTFPSNDSITHTLTLTPTAQTAALSH
jgi:hypothetical protein